MRTVQRTAPARVDRTLLRDAAAIAAAMVAVGASFGAITIAYGLPAWVPFLMSTAVFAGGAQFLAVGLIAAGNPIAAVFAGLLLNARHLPFGLAVADTIGGRWRDRLIGSHLMTDETVAFTLREQDPARRRRTYWLIGCTLFVSWNLGSALGVALGGATGDPATLGLDAAFPAGLIALILPSLRDRDTRLVALTGAAVAVLLTPVLPAGLPVLCALLGLFALFAPRRRKPTRKAPAGGSPGDPEADAAGSPATAAAHRAHGPATGAAHAATGKEPLC
ncbi:MAG TPA: AzlC family ABC transporter permease [Actinoplanes sp.]|nr:AzlC family ABC transporter permease [Actinoplanes sp.]